MYEVSTIAKVIAQTDNYEQALEVFNYVKNAYRYVELKRIIEFNGNYYSESLEIQYK